MKWSRTFILLNSGDVINSQDWSEIHESYIRAIRSIDFPEGSGTLTLRRRTKKPNGQWRRNGVSYLQKRFIKFMTDTEGWEAEAQNDIANKQSPPNLLDYPSKHPYTEPIEAGFGNFDLVTTAKNGTRVAIEWETGNISSSHRSLNKLAIALREQKIQAGVLIVPSRDLYTHLTDRIGNIRELSPYLSMWKEMENLVKQGLIAISVVEHDNLTDDQNFEYLPTGEDGRAREGRSK